MGQTQSMELLPLKAGPLALHGATTDELLQLAQDDYLQVMRNGMNAHPRSHQKMIGPSEIGIECERRLLYKLAQVPEPVRAPAWKPAVGTACHGQQELWFGDELITRAPGRYLIEERVMVGYIGPEQVTGSTDLFDLYTGGVIDHKFVGKSRLLLYRSKGPSQQYRCQAHLYARGWDLAGYKVRYVMIGFVPRDGELGDTHFWGEEYRPDVADWALGRANRLYGELFGLGLEQAVSRYPICDDTYCPWCQTDRIAITTKKLTSNPFSAK